MGLLLRFERRFGLRHLLFDFPLLPITAEEFERPEYTDSVSNDAKPRSGHWTHQSELVAKLMANSPEITQT
jgi:hypothetical protein